MVIRKEKKIRLPEAKNLFQHRGLDPFFSNNELEKYFNGRNYGSIAARYLAKQIILEQLSLGDDLFHEISIYNDPYGKPQADYSGRTAMAVAATEGLHFIHLSLSHSKNFAAAFVIFEYFYKT